MVYRPAAYSSALIRYNMSVVYNPSFIDDSDKIDKEAPKLFLGVARPGSAFYRDIEPSDKEIVIHSATESQYNLPLKIQANKIYCIMAKR